MATINLGELAREAQALKAVEGTPEATIAKPVTKTNAENLFSAEVNYPDIILTKEMKSGAKKMVVIMPSCKGYFVKHIPTKGEPKTELLTSELYAKLTQGMSRIDLPDFWLEALLPGKKFADGLLDVLSDDTLVDMIKHHAIVQADSSAGSLSRHNWGYLYDAEYYSTSPKLYLKDAEVNGRNRLCRYTVDMPSIIEAFGIDNLCDFIEETDKSLMCLSRHTHSYWYSTNFMSSLAGLLQICSFKYSRFKEYVLYTGVRLGYALSSDDFLREWQDYLSMQKTFYGKIKDKYPDNLQLVHQQLSYKFTLHKREIDEKLFAQQATKAAQFEWQCGEYLFLAPRNRDDFYEEATAQANCLAGYVDKFTEGRDYIMFMREKDSPETSYVTLELDVNGRCVQRYQSRNRSCTAEQLDAIAKWEQAIADKKTAPIERKWLDEEEKEEA